MVTEILITWIPIDDFSSWMLVMWMETNPPDDMVEKQINLTSVY